jgi:hypothetical protein
MSRQVLLLHRDIVHEPESRSARNSKPSNHEEDELKKTMNSTFQ